MRYSKLWIIPTMRAKTLLPIIAAAALTACGSVLDVPPTSSVPSELAINDAIGARAALAGAYAGLQAGANVERLGVPENHITAVLARGEKRAIGADSDGVERLIELK